MNLYNLKTSIAASVVALAMSSAAHAGITEINAGLDALSTYNLMVRGDMKAGHDVEGRAFVGGTVNGGAFFNMDGLAGPTPGLTVVGDIKGGAAHVRGDIMVGGSVISGVEFQSSGAQVLSYGGTVSNTNVNSPDTKVKVAGLQTTLAADRDVMFSNLGSLSTHLAGLTTTDTITSDASNVYFNAKSVGDVAVFSISDLTVFNNKSIQFADPSSYGLIVINVTGSDSMMTSGTNFNSPFALKNVIWNFSNLGTNDDGSVDTLAFKNQWFGSILALGAHGSNVTPLEGSVAFGSFAQGGEIHTPGFGDYQFTPPPPPTTAVPEPSAWALMILGFGAAGAMMRRRRAALAA